MNLAPLLALVVRGPSHATITHAIPRRPHVAALLARCLRAEASAAVRAVTLAGAATSSALAPDGLSAEAHAPQIAVAEAIRARCLALPQRDQTPVLVACLRALLVDAPPVCERLDRAVRDAARAHGHEITAEHERAAEAIVEEVL